MEVDPDSYVVIAGSSHPKLAKEIAQHLGVELGEVDTEMFPDVTGSR